ncbi:DNA-binding protein YbaB [Stackebrandtia albiflava]|uniref:DNA-binding protein YbaB n=1 Tax=Stackebrandtia albiflava TaxID=406432 RepID=A0A562UL48_9ACTN|nr:YbaB/EbfC family nucleoid-associated protein [Stackebrandtia albiflava]TWJ06334.1 DNA-binding protein YbaB [Stackebrandtia albiflava]
MPTHPQGPRPWTRPTGSPQTATAPTASPGDSLAEAFRGLTVSATSPRGWVKVTITGSRTHVTLHGRGAGAAAERLLAEEAASAWRTALAKRHRAREELRTSIRGAAVRPADREIVARLRRRRMEVEAIEVTARSPRELVRVRRRGSIEVAVRIRPGTLDHYDDDTLQDELTAAIRAADQARTRARTTDVTAGDEPANGRQRK